MDFYLLRRIKVTIETVYSIINVNLLVVTYNFAPCLNNFKLRNLTHNTEKAAFWWPLAFLVSVTVQFAGFWSFNISAWTLTVYLKNLGQSSQIFFATGDWRWFFVKERVFFPPRWTPQWKVQTCHFFFNVLKTLFQQSKSSTMVHINTCWKFMS